MLRTLCIYESVISHPGPTDTPSPFLVTGRPKAWTVGGTVVSLRHDSCAKEKWQGGREDEEEAEEEEASALRCFWAVFPDFYYALHMVGTLEQVHKMTKQVLQICISFLWVLQSTVGLGNKLKCNRIFNVGTLENFIIEEKQLACLTARYIFKCWSLWKYPECTS